MYYTQTTAHRKRLIHVLKKTDNFEIISKLSLKANNHPHEQNLYFTLNSDKK